MTHGHRRVVVVAVLAAAVTLTSCSGGPAAGPLGFGGDAATQCLPTEEGAAVLVGDVLTAPAGSDVEIVSIELVDPKGVRLEESLLMPIENGEAIGSSTMPPADPPGTWDERVDAEGGVVQAGSEGNLLLAIARTGDDDGTIAAVRVGYEIDGVQYSKSGSTDYVLTATC